MGGAILATASTAPAAHAAVLTNVGGTLNYAATPGETNLLLLQRDEGDVLVTDSGAPVMLGIPNCVPERDSTVRCTGVVDAVVALADGDDTLTVLGELRVDADGGPGADALAGGPAADVLDGGEGKDAVGYSGRNRRVIVTLDNEPGDGEAGEQDLVLRIEVVLGGGGGDILHGDDGPNELVGGGGDDSINGGGGDDEIDGGAGNDGVNALDPAGSGGDGSGGAGEGGSDDGGSGGSGSPAGAAGLLDEITCGDGRDRVFSDVGDGIGGDCERSLRGAQAGVTPESIVDAGAPPPELGRSVVIEPVSGVVLFSPPEPGTAPRRREDVPADPAMPLDRETNVPVGSVVDTRFGTVRMTIAIDHAGTTNAGDFHSGSFQVFQDERVGAVGELELRGGKSFARCPAAQRGPGVTARASARRRRAVRRLWGRATGRFRTRGRYGSASVRGTRWLTMDRCDGTLLRVREGVVEVADLLRGRELLVRAGRSYLVRAPR